MTVSVLIVDDSGFFRRRLTEIVNQCEGLSVVGTASNGREAVSQAKALKPDVITMDYEMPVMDGISAVREIMSVQPTPILMFSSLTYEGARVTLDSLEAGAVDYLPKNFEEIARDSEELKRKLTERLLAVAGASRRFRSAAPSTFSAPGRGAPVPSASVANSISPSTTLRGVGAAGASSVSPAGRGSSLATAEPIATSAASAVPAGRRKLSSTSRRYSLVAIGTSTGGPVALQKVLTELPANFPLPIVLIQHMPESFTGAFAERLNSLCRIQVKQAVDGDLLRPGLALLAPGGKQMMIAAGGKIRILPGDERLNYKPCVDITFGSAAKVYPRDTLAIVLTGMGADGRDGARMLKEHGSTVWAQDEATSVIYGMPMAIARANLADEILPLHEIGPQLCQLRN